MKKIIVHTVAVLISLIWLFINHHTLNPVSVKGPVFLKFYLMLLLSYYISIFILKFFKERIGKTTWCFMVSIFFLGVIKLIRGISLGKPIGFLVMILIIEIVVTLMFALLKPENNRK